MRFVQNLLPKIFVVLLSNHIISCYIEWDYPVVSRTDPCTGKASKSGYYVNPTCRRYVPPPPEPPSR
jgi:hypothetical protein